MAVADYVEGVVDPSELHPEVKDIFIAYRDTFSSVSGQKVLEDLKKSYQDKSTYDPDPYKTALNEGARTVYLLIVAMIQRGKDLSQKNEVEVGRNRPITEVVT